MNVSHETHPDLYFALRGGGNQFGVVTRFELDTYAQGPIWGGHSFYLLDDIPARKLNLHIQNKFSWTIGSLFQKLSHWTVRLACQLGYCSSINALLTEFTAFTQSTDPLAQIILTFVFVPYNINTWVACLNRVYGAPDPDPAVFQGFAAQDRRSIHSTNRITTLSGINAEVDGMNIPGFRYVPIILQSTKLAKYADQTVLVYSNLPNISPLYVRLNRHLHHRNRSDLLHPGPNPKSNSPDHHARGNTRIPA